MRRWWALLWLLVLGCAPHEERPQTHPGFLLEPSGAGWNLHVSRPWAGASDTLRYTLGGEPRAGYVHVPIPAQRIVAFSSTHTAFLEVLGQLDAVIGLAETDFVYSPAVRERVGRGAIVEVASSEGLDPEVLLALQPDVILFSGLSSPGPALLHAQQAGIPVVVIGEWAESTPLNRAAWIHVLGALTGTHDAAARHFNAVRDRYEALAQDRRAREERPVVLAGSPFRGTWFVPGGASYMAALLRDAGGAYPWADHPSTGSLSLDEEAVLAAAAGASVWLTGNRWPTLADARSEAPVIAQFLSVQTGRVYQADARSVPSGGTDFFESAVVHPDRVLQDVIQILHTEESPVDSLRYYRRLDESRPRQF